MLLQPARTSFLAHTALDTHVPENPGLQCWRPTDGLILGISHDADDPRGGHGRDEQALDFRPSGFRLLGDDSTFVWRCRKVTKSLAESCSTRAGEAVFTCTSTRARLTCRNRDDHGFSFYTF